MKLAVVPAQVTTVEDKVAGSLSLQQLILLASPLFLGCALYGVIPPIVAMTSFKIIVVGIIALIGCTLAIRIRGKLLLNWAIVVMRYNLRPRYYVYSKNESHLRPKEDAAVSEAAIAESSDELDDTVLPFGLSTSELVRVESVLNDVRANVAFKTNRKGDLYVHITQVNE